jgi:hypothetical protein
MSSERISVFKCTAFLLHLLAFIHPFSLKGQANLYDLQTIQEIDIQFTQSDWDYQLDTAKSGSDGYIIASHVVINGINFDSAGIKYKGFSSYDSTQVKNPFHIELDHIKPNQSYTGYTDIKLGNSWSDPSSIREVLSYFMLSNYMDAPRANFARVFVNGAYWGLYSNTESINKGFLDRHFYSSGNTFVKCNPSIVGSYFSNLDYLGSDSLPYENRYEMKSKYSWKEFIGLCDTLENNPAGINSMLDIDRVLWMLAFNNVTVNLDSYSGAFSQNYYLYKDDNNRFNPVIWDLNMCLGGFANSGGGILSLFAMQHLNPMLHASDSAWPLISRVLIDPLYQRMYIAHMRTIKDDFFTNNLYDTIAHNLQTLIDSSLMADTNSLYSYIEFQHSLTTDIPGGLGIIPGILNLMTPRYNYLINTPELQKIPPVVSLVQVTPISPLLNDTIWFTCQALNAGLVKMGYRYFSPLKFEKTEMFDDGNHHDGSAGDNIYGASVLAASTKIDYYIYAENADAGVFTPEQAEHAYYQVTVNAQASVTNDVVINEFVSVNQNGVTDLEGDHEDWIELFNTTGSDISLSDYYLSDNIANPQKWVFPANTVIPANGFIAVWADDEIYPGELHCNFKLSGSGETLLLSMSGGIVVDSISFPQQMPDKAIARCPDGTGNFNVTWTPTYMLSNYCTNGIYDEFPEEEIIIIYPNPSEGIIYIRSGKPVDHLELFGPLGALMKESYFLHQQFITWDVSSTGPGMYFLRINGKLVKKILIE